jgi:hypothetical protein
VKFDIVKDYDWTSSPRGSAIRKKAPRVWVKSFKINSNLVLNRFKSYAELATVAEPDEFYDKLYGDATEPEDDFNFPFFQDSIRSFGNVFGDTFQNGFGGGGGIGEALDGKFQTAASIVAQGANAASISKRIGGAMIEGALNGSTVTESATNSIRAGIGAMAGTSPGSYMETPKFYEYSSANEGPLNVSFVLANTINDDYDKNYKLIKRLTEINRPKRINSIAMEPPRIYQVKVPGHRFIRWAYCSDFDVTFLGTKRNIDGIIVPEGYQVSMSFQSLTIEVSNFMDKV